LCDIRFKIWARRLCGSGIICSITAV